MGEYLKKQYEKKENNMKKIKSIHLNIKQNEKLTNIIDELLSINNETKNLMIVNDQELTFTDISLEEFSKYFLERKKTNDLQHVCS